MTDWIDINLPWQNYTTNEDLPPLPDEPLDQRAIIELGMTYNQSSNTISEELEDDYMAVGWEEGDKEEALELEKFAPIKKHQEFMNRWRTWYNKQPEVIEWNKQVDEIRSKAELNSFCGRRLNTQGTMIEVESNGVTRYLLIGDINTEGGICDDCPAFDKGAIVKRYRQVYYTEEQIDV